MTTLSPYVLTVLASLVIAQGLKYCLLLIRGRTIDPVRQLYQPGNMPSAHSTSVVALLTLIGLRDGVESGLFGLALLFAIITIYDAVMVRRSVGEQGKAIHALIKAAGNGMPLPRAAKGHTPFELLVGAALGALIGSVVFLATN